MVAGASVAFTLTMAPFFSTGRCFKGIPGKLPYPCLWISMGCIQTSADPCPELEGSPHDFGTNRHPFCN